MSNIEKRVAIITVATMIEDAKKLLLEAKSIADDYGIAFSYQSIYEDITGDRVDWNSSSYDC